MLFQVAEFSGEVTVNGAIDYEETPFINFTVIATDSGVPPLSSQNEYLLKVVDQNDNSPSFISPRYSATISEDARNGTFVLSVNATDKDSGKFGKVNYFLLNELSNPAPFAINSTSGVISVNGNLDREKRSVYSLTVKAADDYDGHLNPDSHETTTVVSFEVSPFNQTLQLGIWHYLRL